METTQDKAAAPARSATTRGPFTSGDAAPIAPGKVLTRAPPLEVPCSTCLGVDPCLPCSPSGGDVARVDALVLSRRSVKQGCALFHQGDRFEFIYCVRSGTFKSTMDLRDGCGQVTGFQMTGELLGLDGLASGRHASSTVALEDAETWPSRTLA